MLGKTVKFKITLNWGATSPCFEGVVIESGIRIGAKGNGTQNFQVVVAKCVNGLKKTVTVKDHIKKDEDYVDLKVTIGGTVHTVRINRETIEGFPRKNQ